ncbi:MULTISPECIES: PAS domain S-box protein [Rhodomicrobium]|uniref:PAS domain S-box protein n=1 Tax=Rhodomicrobium TaxID=1068 RepID=UPI0014833DBF|nr:MULTISPECIES: PAS domain S-box protein [Rhodomicrobium]
MREESWPLSTHLIVLALAIMVPLLGLAGFALRSSFATERAAAFESTQRMADAVTDSLDREFISVKTILNVLAQDTAFDRGEYRTLYDRAKEGLKGRHGNLALAGPDGAMIFYTRYPFGTDLPPPRLADDVDRDAGKTLSPSLTNLFTGSASQKQLFATVVPIERNGRAAGWLHFTMEPQELATAIAEPALLPGADYILADGAGKVVLTSSKMLASPDMLPASILDAAKGDFGVFETKVGDSPMLVSYRRSALTGWTGYSIIPLAAIEAPLSRLWHDFLITSIIALGLSIIAAFLFSRTMTRPMHELMRAATAFGLGESAPLPHSTLREANLLAETLSEASTTLRTRTDELRQSERRFRLFAERTPDAIWFLNVERDQMDYVSPAFETIWGRPTAELTGMAAWSETIYPDDLAALGGKLELKPSDKQIEYRIVRPDGSTRWVRDTRFLLQASEGQPGVLAGIVRDFTARKEAVDALTAARVEAENRMAELEHLYENAPIGLAVIGTDYRIQRVNDFVVKLSGKPPESHVGQPIFDLLPNMQEAAEGPFEELQKTGRAIRGIEFQARIGSEQEARFWSAHLYPIHGADGTVKCIGIILEDISAEKLHQRELARLAAIVYAANDAMFSASPDGVILNWNPAAETLFQYSDADAVGKPLSMLFPPRADGEHDALMRELKKGESSRIDTELRRKDGKLVPISISLAPIKRGEETIAVSITIEDITERKRSEARQLLMNRELAHRVKNSLAVIQAMARHTLRSSPSPEAFTKAFEGRLQALSTSHNLLTASQWEGAELRDLIREQLAPSGAGTGRLKLSGQRLTLPPGIATSLGLVLHELATNAVKYGSLSVPRGRVEIAWTVDSSGKERRLKLDWREVGGPPVTEPAEKGFGSTLIAHSGRVTQHFDPEGLHCTVEMAFAEDAPPLF